MFAIRKNGKWSGQGQTTMFSTVKYRAIDYVCEASARYRLMMSLLTLPIPLPLGDPTYPHSGHLQDKAFRTPWTFGNLSSGCYLEVTRSVSDDLRADLCSGDFLERFGVCLAELGGELDEVVPSSNLAYEDCVGVEKALLLLGGFEGVAEHVGWRESFTLHAGYPSCLSYQDLVLPEDLIGPDPLVQFKTRMPSFPSLVQRLKTLPVSDPLRSCSGAHLSEHIILRHCAPYEVSPAKLDCSSETLSATEEFRKECILNVELLMLPVGIETEVLQQKDLTSIPRLQESLNISPEPAEEQRSLLDTLIEAIPPGIPCSSVCETFSVPVFDSDITGTHSPVPCKSYVEMETDMPLSPPDRPVQPELYLPTNQLSTEQLSPDYRGLLSYCEREVMEKTVWCAEKHPHCLAGLMLAEPQMSVHTIRVQSLSELISVLGAERDDSEPLIYLEDRLRLAPHSPAWGLLGEGLTVDVLPATETVSADSTEKFSVLSIVQIDELLKGSAKSSVQGLRPSVSGASVQSVVQVASGPDSMCTVKTVKFMLVEETSQKQRKHSEARPDHTNPGMSMTELSVTSAVHSPSEINTPEQLLTNPANHPNLSESPPKKRGYGILKSAVTQPTHTHFEATQSRELTNTVSDPDPAEELKAPWVTPAKQRPDLRHVRAPASGHTEHGVQERGPAPAALSSSAPHQQGSTSACEEQHLDPLTSFIVLRRLQKNPAVQTHAHTTLRTTDGVKATPFLNDLPQKSVGKPTVGSDMTAVQEDPDMAENSETSLHDTEQAISKIIQTEASESERGAFWELHALAVPALCRVADMGLNALSSRDFSSLIPEDTRFSLKQQERELSMGQGRKNVCNDVALLHILVTAKELLLKCDLDTATDYLAKAQATCPLAALGQLLRRFQVLQYLSSRRAEPRPRHQHLLEQMGTWLKSTTCSAILVVTAVESVRVDLVTVLSQVPGNSVAEVLPEEGKSKVDSKQVINSLSCSRCVVVCSQQVGAGFPWWRFRVVLEFDCVGHSPISSVCAKNNINYISFRTTVPPAGSDPSVMPSPVYLDSVPFLLFITEGLLKHSGLLQQLESTYHMTLLERSHSPSLQQLGATHMYDIITVDEGTAILLQGLSELQQDKACERVVMRLSALSLQFTHCWVLLHCSDHPEAVGCGEVFSNLVLIYSVFVLFGLKSEDLEVKVFLLCDVADIAQCVYQICLHTLLNSERDVQSRLNPDWFGVLPTEAEQCLLCFPCVNCAVAQLMLCRTPSLQWLLTASLSELESKFPEIPHKVCKLFSDTTAQHRLSAAPCQSECHTVAPLQTNVLLQPPDLHPHPHPHLHSWDLGVNECHSSSALPHTQPPLLLTQSPKATQHQNTGANGWVGAERGTSRGQSVCAATSQPWAGDHGQDESHAGPAVGGEEGQWAVEENQRTVEAVSPPGFSLTHTHSPCTVRPSPGVLLEQGWSVSGGRQCYSVTGGPFQGGLTPVRAPPHSAHNPPQHQSMSDVCGVGRWGQQREIYRTSPLYRGTERKRSAGLCAGNSMQTAFPQYKRGKLLFERIPGRTDGQTRLRFL